MIRSVLAMAATELRIAIRNRWAVTAAGLMTLFALALSFAGSAPTGALGVDLLTVSVASMTTLAVYLAPLLALLIAYDAFAGEADRGSLALLLSYPVGRGALLAGKFLAHLVVLSGAIALGFGSAAAVAGAVGGAGPDSLRALVALIATAILLGAVFLALGAAISASAGSASGAMALAFALWLVAVVLFDLGLLGAVVYDDGGAFTRRVFPWLLVANPADAFRLWNLGGEGPVALASGMAGAASALPPWAAPVSLGVWCVLALGLARLAVGRMSA